MKGDIKNNNILIEYPKMKEFIDIDGNTIINLIKSFQKISRKFEENKEYYIGKNTFINNKCEITKDNPDSRISVSYVRTMTQIIKGFMFKPGNIKYTSQNQQYLNKLNEIFKYNNEPLKTSELGENQSKFGIGIELLYSDENNQIKFINVCPEECILIYDYSIESKIIGAIRYLELEKIDNKEIYRVEVYYKDKVQIWQMIEEYEKYTITLQTEEPHFFQDIPYVIYENNNELQADYEPIKCLIDAYDTMMSDSINEMNRFANAYLILKNFIVANLEDENEQRLALEKLKTTRIMQFMGTDGGAEFLTRSIPSEFFEVVKRTLREDIEFHSHVPDFRSKNFEAKSGVAMLYSLFDFENLCSDKQALFEVGLKRRIDLINNYLKINAVETDNIEITFQRNIPANVTEIIDNFKKLAETNKVSDEDLLQMLPKEIIKNVENSLEKMKQQKQENIEMFSLDNNNFGGQNENQRFDSNSTSV